MALGIRGINPIWFEVDLQARAFDDDFYLYILQNTIPYIPATVYHDVNLSQPWINPIEFLANGTLPIDIYFDPTQVYRLEFRQNNGIDPPSQNDALIYEVNDYVPGTGGSTPITTVAFPTGNQVANPQFALFNFAGPSIATVITTAGTYNIAPGWFLDLAGSGTATITQVPLTSLNPTKSNAPYALHIVISGWDPDSVILRQRFSQNGVLWSGMVVAAAITASTGTGFATLTANLVPDVGAPTTVLSVPVVNTTLTEYTGHATIPASTDTTVPPAAYIEIQIPLSSTSDMYFTSVQLVVENPAMPFEPSFIQNTVDLQIDGTYHTEYPIVPVGTVIDFAGFTVPLHYFNCDGSTKNRLIYNQLFRALTTVETVSLTNTMNTFTVVSSANYRIGMAIEGNGIPASTTITVISGTTITISNAATATVSSAITFFAAGNGDGSTTFTLPDLQGYVTAGLGGTSVFAAGLNGVGSKGGASTHLITRDEMPQHTHDPLTGTGFWMNTTGQPQGPTAGAASAISAATTDGITGYAGPSALSLVQQTYLMRKCIRYE